MGRPQRNRAPIHMLRHRLSFLRRSSVSIRPLA
jgi:hypothetical protein